jgi:hypothetical protein
MKGMAQYSSPPCTERSRLASINNVYSICIITNQAKLMRRSSVLNLPFQLVFPWTQITDNNCKQGTLTEGDGSVRLTSLLKMFL